MSDQGGGLVEREVTIPPSDLPGRLSLPARASGLVIFAHGSGSGRFSPRNRAVAQALNARGFATLLFDLLTESEAEDRRNVFDIGLLARRVCDAVDWAQSDPGLAHLPIGLFGASTGAAASLVAAAGVDGPVQAVVSRGGRPDLAGLALMRVPSPTLLIVGGDDHEVIELNQQALGQLRCDKSLRIVEGASHLFPEPGALETVTRLAGDWFAEHLRRPGA